MIDPRPKPNPPRREEREHRVVGVDQQQQARQVEEVPVRVHEEEEPALAAVAGSGLRDGAGRRALQDRAVDRLAVVVAGATEAQQDGEHDDRQRDPHRQVAEDRAEVRRAGGTALADARRVQRRQVVVLTDPVPLPHEQPDHDVAQQHGEQPSPGRAARATSCPCAACALRCGRVPPAALVVDDTSVSPHLVEARDGAPREKSRTTSPSRVPGTLRRGTRPVRAGADQVRRRP